MRARRRNRASRARDGLEPARHPQPSPRPWLDLEARRPIRAASRHDEGVRLAGLDVRLVPERLVAAALTLLPKGDGGHLVGVAVRDERRRRRHLLYLSRAARVAGGPAASADAAF